MNKFSVTYEIVTPESAEYGDAEDRGWVVEDATLRDALEACNGCGCYCEPDSSFRERPRWLTFYKVNEGTREYYETGAEESRSLHIPDTVTVASARRIARLAGAYGF